MRTMHLFAGIGGGLLADLILGHQPVVAVEWEPYACKVLRERAAEGWFPGLSVWEGDVRLFDPSEYTGKVDCIHAGFPCQDISVAGKQAGVSEGTRSGLYREVLRIAGVVRPKQLFLENVSAILSNGLGTVLGDLAALGYDTRWLCIRASDVGAPHHRDRWFLLADSDFNGNGNSGAGRGVSNEDWNSQEKEPRRDELSTRIESSSDVANAECLSIDKRFEPEMQRGWKDEAEQTWLGCGDVAHTMQWRLQTSKQKPWEIKSEGYASLGTRAPQACLVGGGESGIGATESGLGELAHGLSDRFFGYWETEPEIGRVASGIANRVGQLKGYGNAQVPLQAATAYRLLGGI